MRSKTYDLEQRLSEDRRSLLVADSRCRDQSRERAVLLLMIYQYVDLGFI